MLWDSPESLENTCDLLVVSHETHAKEATYTAAKSALEGHMDRVPVSGSQRKGTDEVIPEGQVSWTAQWTVIKRNLEGIQNIFNGSGLAGQKPGEVTEMMHKEQRWTVSTGIRSKV